MKAKEPTQGDAARGMLGGVKVWDLDFNGTFAKLARIFGKHSLAISLQRHIMHKDHQRSAPVVS